MIVFIYFRYRKDKKPKYETQLDINNGFSCLTILSSQERSMTLLQV